LFAFPPPNPSQQNLDFSKNVKLSEPNAPNSWSSTKSSCNRFGELFRCRQLGRVIIRSDNGAEFTCHKVRSWLEQVNVKTLFITPGSAWENGYILVPKSDEEIRSETKARLSMSEFEKEKAELGDL
jgi:hypothetical protein